MPNATQEGRQKVAEGDTEDLPLPTWGDGTVNHGYLQTDTEATSQVPQ